MYDRAVQHGPTREVETDGVFEALPKRVKLIYRLWSIVLASCNAKATVIRQISASASSSSDVRRSSCSCRSAAGEWLRRAEIDASFRVALVVLRCRVFIVLRLTVPCRCTEALQFGRRTISYHSMELRCALQQFQPPDVRFGS